MTVVFFHDFKLFIFIDSSCFIYAYIFQKMFAVIIIPHLYKNPKFFVLYETRTWI